MASSPSISRVAVECVNNSICKFGRLDGRNGRYECGGIWCASKLPLIRQTTWPQTSVGPTVKLVKDSLPAAPVAPCGRVMPSAGGALKCN
ncbi:hypothetical protein CTI12_AA404240 [Artemisia annua]|uniref:Uncharacterized protein n=1 Tax=Artemisia annua TaxID=35608 RepID=A0A2U1M9T2_ARTAN|nr:hypothetical protein CTI12_AA404240 [Artemisia annua]